MIVSRFQQLLHEVCKIMVCSESQNPRQLDLDGPTIPDRRPAASTPTSMLVSRIGLGLLGTIAVQYACILLKEDQQDRVRKLSDADLHTLGLQWRTDHLREDDDCCRRPAPVLERFQTSGEELTCSVAASERTDEDAQSGSESVQETEALLFTDRYAFSLNQCATNCIIQKVSVNGFESESPHQCRSMVKEREVSEIEENKSDINTSVSSRRTLEQKDTKDCEYVWIVEADCERIWGVETCHFIPIISPVLQQKETDDGEQAVQPEACDLSVNHDIRQLTRELDSVPMTESAFKISLVLPLLSNGKIPPGNGEQAQQPDVCDLLANRSIGRLARDLDSVLMTDSASKISLVLASLLGRSLPESCEQTLQCNACDLANHAIRQLAREVNSVCVFKILQVFAPLLNSRLLAENGGHTLPHCDVRDLLTKQSIRQLTRELDSVPMTESAFKVLAPLLNSSLLLLLLALAELYLVNLLLFDLEFSDLAQLLRLLVLEITSLLLSSASLYILRLLRKPMRTNSSETMVMITITLSCCVRVTSSAPPHPPNLLIRMVEGEGRTYYVPLLGSPNSGYCANIAIGVKHPQEVYFISNTVCVWSGTLTGLL